MNTSQCGSTNSKRARGAVYRVTPQTTEKDFPPTLHRASPLRLKAPSDTNMCRAKHAAGRRTPPHGNKGPSLRRRRAAARTFGEVPLRPVVGGDGEEDHEACSTGPGHQENADTAEHIRRGRVALLTERAVDSGSGRIETPKARCPTEEKI